MSRLLLLVGLVLGTAFAQVPPPVIPCPALANPNMTFPCDLQGQGAASVLGNSGTFNVGARGVLVSVADVPIGWLCLQSWEATNTSGAYYVHVNSTISLFGAASYCTYVKRRGSSLTLTGNFAGSVPGTTCPQDADDGTKFAVSAFQPTQGQGCPALPASGAAAPGLGASAAAAVAVASAAALLLQHAHA